MSKLNLPPEFEDMLEAVEQRKRNMFTAKYFELSFDVLEKVLIALSEARNTLIDVNVCFEADHYNCQDCKDKVKEAIK